MNGKALMNHHIKTNLKQVVGLRFIPSIQAERFSIADLSNKQHPCAQELILRPINAATKLTSVSKFVAIL